MAAETPQQAQCEMKVITPQQRHWKPPLTPSRANVSANTGGGNSYCKMKRFSCRRRDPKATYSKQKQKPPKLKTTPKDTVFLYLDKVKSIPTPYQVQVKVNYSPLKFKRSGNN
jgi:hypothetical protein